MLNEGKTLHLGVNMVLFLEEFYAVVPQVTATSDLYCETNRSWNIKHSIWDI